MINWIIYFTVLAGAITALMIITNHAISKKLDTNDLEYSILAARVINSPACLGYQQVGTDRTYPGIIDINKLDSDWLDGCLLSTQGRPIGLKVELKRIDRVIYGNQSIFEDIKPLTFSNLYHKEERKAYVFVQNKKQRTRDLLTITIVGKSS